MSHKRTLSVLALMRTGRTGSGGSGLSGGSGWKSSYRRQPRPTGRDLIVYELLVPSTCTTKST